MLAALDASGAPELRAYRRREHRRLDASSYGLGSVEPAAHCGLDRIPDPVGAAPTAPPAAAQERARCQSAPRALHDRKQVASFQAGALAPFHTGAARGRASRCRTPYSDAARRGPCGSWSASARRASRRRGRDASPSAGPSTPAWTSAAAASATSRCASRAAPSSAARPRVAAAQSDSTARRRSPSGRSHGRRQGEPSARLDHALLPPSIPSLIDGLHR